MRFSSLIAVIYLLGVSMATAQTLPKVSGVEDYWLEGEKRIYRFSFEGQEIGRLEALIDNVEREDGRVYYDIEENLTLDLTAPGRGIIIDLDGTLRVDASGHFQTADIRLGVDDREEDIRAAYSAPDGEIIARRGDDDQASRSIGVSGPVFAYDNYMIHHLEMALAMHSLSPNAGITIPVFSIQGLYTTDYEFTVIGKVRVQYGAFTDSVWQVDMVRPAQLSLYIDRKHRLVKMIDPNQNLDVEMVVDPYAKRRAPQKSMLEYVNDQMIRLPIYGLYLFITFVWLLFLGRDSYRMGWSYLLFIIGGLAYPIIYYTQAPLQQSYAMNVLGPAMGAGESIVIPAIIPAMITGIIQESLKLIPLLIIARLIKPKQIALVSLGAFIGAGFGFVEACHIVAPMFQSHTLTGYTLIERVFTIMFQMTMGAVLGYGLARDKIWQFWLVAVGLHAFSNYLVIFVQMKTLTIKGLNIVLGLFDITLLVGAVILQRVHKQYHLISKKAKR